MARRLMPVLLLAAGTLPGTTARAADLPGAKDHPLLKRFAGSEIVGYDVKRFDAVELQTATFQQYNFKTKKLEFVKPALHLEGARTQIWYEAVSPASSVELIRNYQNELKAKGFQILYDSAKDPAAGRWVNFLTPFGEGKLETNRSAYVFTAARESGVRVCTARLARPEGDVYVRLTAVDWTEDRPVYKARRGAYIAVDILEVAAMTQHMVVVSADDMARTISASGRVALYGIYFDTDKATIKPESRAALAEIAKLLKQEPKLQLHVVGHTDNTGGFEHNMALSKQRADAVVAALTMDYGVAPGRLASNGVAYLAPVATNATEEGRAKNRRVELVPR
jgi:outer membrane protein OmpA-like peptidoglycan-associated protein